MEDIVGQKQESEGTEDKVMQNPCPFAFNCLNARPTCKLKDHFLNGCEPVPRPPAD